MHSWAISSPSDPQQLPLHLPQSRPHLLEHNHQRANTLNDMSQAYKRKEKEKGSLLTRAHTSGWRLQENKTEDKYATRPTIYTKR